MNQKYLVIQTAFIGDVVLTTPLLRELALTGAVTLITTPVAAAALQGLPGVEIITYDKKNEGLLAGLARVRKSVGDQKFSKVYCVHRSPRSLLLGKLIQADQRIGFSSMLAKALDYQTFPYPEYSEDWHFVDKVLSLLGEKKQFNRRPWLAEVTSQESQEVLNKFHLGSPYIVLSLFSEWGTKMWPQEYFMELANMLTKTIGIGVVLTGAIKDRSLLSEVWKAQENSQIIDLVGETKMRELSVIIANAKLVVANDSAPIHIAAAYDIPTVSLFGPTVKKWGFFPLSTKYKVLEQLDLSCRPCGLHGPQKCPRQHFRCMRDTKPEQVFSAVQALL